MIINEDEFLEHYGKKGMQWGVRKANREGVSRKTDKEARKDATEFARAKMFYGKGAGTRRKLIRESVEAKRKRDPDYSRAFDRNLDNQNMSDHASGARSERTRTDRRQTARRSAGSVARRFTGEMGTTAAFTTAAVAGATFINSPRGRAMASNTVNQAQRFVRDQNIQRRVQDLINTIVRN